jgi:nitrate reductase NapAB chaperone NapD
MVISSVVVTTDPGQLAEVSLEAGLVPGVEVYAELAEQFKLVLVLESETLASSHALVTQSIQSIPGVLNIQLSYCNYEESEQ